MARSSPPPDAPTQSIDVRDLAEWIVVSCERRLGGVYNATHPGFSWQELLDTCIRVAGSDARITWVAPEFLVEQEVGEWMELPLWLSDPSLAYADRVAVERALGAGLAFRPLEETVRGTLELAETTEAAGLAPAREAELLARWRDGR